MAGSPRTMLPTPPGSMTSPCPVKLAAEAIALDPTDPITARRLAVAAWRASPTVQAGSAITTLLTEQQHDGILYDSETSAYAATFSPNSKLLATRGRPGRHGAAMDPATGLGVGAPLQAGGFVTDVALSPAGSLLASAESDGTVRLWDPVTGHPVGAPLSCPGRKQYSL